MWYVWILMISWITQNMEQNCFKKWYTKCKTSHAKYVFLIYKQLLFKVILEKCYINAKMIHRNIHRIINFFSIFFLSIGLLQIVHLKCNSHHYNHHNNSCSNLNEHSGFDFSISNTNAHAVFICRKILNKKVLWVYKLIT